MVSLCAVNERAFARRAEKVRFEFDRGAALGSLSKHIARCKTAHTVNRSLVRLTWRPEARPPKLQDLPLIYFGWVAKPRCVNCVPTC